MVHSMDAISSKWRDDPVRAALEKKKNREAAADRLVQANAIASELLKKRLAASSASNAFDAADEQEGAAMTDADYRKLLERQRKKLMDGDDSDSSSSNISVFDPFQSKCAAAAAASHRTRLPRARTRTSRSRRPSPPSAR